MSEHKLRDAFDHMGPDEAARERMLQNILQAHEAGVGAEAQPEEQPQTQPRRSPRGQFSLLRYALPIAACLLFAALIPPTLPEIVTAFEESTAPPSYSEDSNDFTLEVTEEGSESSLETEGEQPGNEQPNNQQPEDTAPGDTAETPVPLNPADDPAMVAPESTPGSVPPLSVVVEEAVEVEMAEAPNYAPPITVEAEIPPMVIPDPWPSPVDYVALTLSALALLAAIFITIRAVLSWRRTQQK
ncbi:MAG: hypothetical protein FWE41_01175 [Coriobacteriia bacterium]|nr:hypothetical protein [Coriobacteriia bacterium]MCL2749498.1 hypothetical protein [Coriobacteriia bacterium]